MRSNFIYGFNGQKMFRTGYMTRNNKSSQEYTRHDKNNIHYRGILSAKSK